MPAEGFNGAKERRTEPGIRHHDGRHRGRQHLFQTTQEVVLDTAVTQLAAGINFFVQGQAAPAYGQRCTQQLLALVIGQR